MLKNIFRKQNKKLQPVHKNLIYGIRGNLMSKVTTSVFLKFWHVNQIHDEINFGFYLNETIKENF
jgi:hypothetical protein